METWDKKFNTVLHGSNPLPDAEWLRFYLLLDDWIASIDATTEMVGSTQKEEERQEKKQHRKYVTNRLARVPNGSVLQYDATPKGDGCRDTTKMKYPIRCHCTCDSVLQGIGIMTLIASGEVSCFYVMLTARIPEKNANLQKNSPIVCIEKIIAPISITQVVWHRILHVRTPTLILANVTEP